MTETPIVQPRFIALTIDCGDLERMATFWSTLLGSEIQGIERPFAFLTPPEKSGISIWLQEVPEGRAGKNRIHLDLATRDLDAAIARIEELGGSVGDRFEWSSYVWRQCFDPEGNVFDVMQAAPAE